MTVDLIYIYYCQVDHFNYVNQDRYKQRYIISDDEWCDGCPIFFYAGNEGDIFMFANNTGFMWENAKQFRAMVLFAEHRYYGQSLPYGKLNRVTIFGGSKISDLITFVYCIEPERYRLFDHRTSSGRLRRLLAVHQRECSGSRKEPSCRLRWQLWRSAISIASKP